MKIRIDTNDGKMKGYSGQVVEIELQNERGDVVEKSLINFVEFLYFVDYSILSKEYPWLATIDPFGNTVFNVLQIPNLVKDLEKLSIKNKEKTSTVEEVITFVKKIDTHLYI